MQVSVETTKGLERRMTVAVPADKIENEIKTRLTSLASRVKVSGFRPGKVPFGVVKRQYGGQVQSEVISELVQNSFYEAVIKEKLRLAGSPTIEPKARQEGEALEYTAVFEVYPDVEIKPLEKLKMEVPLVEITDADVGKTIDQIRGQRLVWNEVDRASQDGDQVLIDFKGSIDGVPFQGGEAEDFEVELGAGRMIAGFEDNLKGKSAGEQVSFTVTFPEDYFGKDVAGKEARFDCQVKAVKASSIPEVDEDFIKSLGIADGTVEGLNAEVRANMQRELESRIKGITKQRVMDLLADNNKIELPRALVDKEIEHMKQRNPAAGTQADSGDLETEARRRVTLGLILSEIINKNEFKAEAKDVRAAVEDIASTYERPEEVVQWYYADKKRLGDVESVVLEQKAVDWVAEQVSRKEKKQTFDDLMGIQK